MTAPRSPQPDPTPHVHDQRYDGDDPYLVCRECGARWDAISGRPLNDQARTNWTDPTSPDPSEAAVTDLRADLDTIDRVATGPAHRTQILRGWAKVRARELEALVRSQPSAPERPDLTAALQFVLEYVDWDDVGMPQEHRDAILAALRAEQVEPESDRWLVPASAKGTTNRTDEWGRQLYVISFDQPHPDTGAIPLRAEQVERPSLDVDEPLRVMGAMAHAVSRDHEDNDGCIVCVAARSVLARLSGSAF